MTSPFCTSPKQSKVPCRVQHFPCLRCADRSCLSLSAATRQLPPILSLSSTDCPVFPILRPIPSQRPGRKSSYHSIPLFSPGSLATIEWHRQSQKHGHAGTAPLDVTATSTAAAARLSAQGLLDHPPLTTHPALRSSPTTLCIHYAIPAPSWRHGQRE